MLPAFVLRAAYTACYAPQQTDVTLATSPAVHARGGSELSGCPNNTNGLLRVQAAGARRPRDAHLRSKPDEATVEPEPGEGARTDTHEDREPAARAALTFTRKDAGRGAAQLPDGRKRLGRDASHSQTRHAPVIRLRRLFR